MNMLIKNADIVFQKNDDGTIITTITPHADISIEDLIDLLRQVYDEENKEDCIETYYLRLKGLSTELLAEAFKYSLSREDLKDPLMLLNIVNYIKNGTKLNSLFFENEDI